MTGPDRDRRRGVRRVSLAAAMLAAAAVWLSFDDVRPLAPAASEGDCVAVSVLSNGFHAGVALPAASARRIGIDPGAAPWVELGWGEARAYQAASLDAGTALAAVLTPGPTAVFAAPLPGRPAPGPRSADAFLSRAGLAQLEADLSRELARDPDGRPRVLSRRYGGTFYAANGAYRIWRTCNVWTAQQLRRAGLDVRVRPAVLADGLVEAVRRAPRCRPA